MDDHRERIRAFLLRHLGTADLNDKDDIFTLGFVNSLFAMQMLAWIEREFEIEITDDDLEIRNFNSVQAIHALVRRKAGPSIEI